MKKLIIDTNVLLRFLLKNVPHQAEEARKVFKQAEKGEIKLIIPQIVIFEIIFQLIKLYKFEKNKVIEAIKIILNTDYFEIQDNEVFQEALKKFKLANISFANCFIASYSEKQKGEVFTFDKKLIKLSKKL